MVKNLTQVTGFIQGTSGAVINIADHDATLFVKATTADATLSRELKDASSYQDIDTVASGTTEKAEGLDAGNYKITSTANFYYSVSA